MFLPVEATDPEAVLKSQGEICASVGGTSYDRPAHRSTGGVTPPLQTPEHVSIGGDTTPTPAYVSADGIPPRTAQVSIGGGMMWSVGSSLSVHGSGPESEREFQFTVPTVQDPVGQRRTSMSTGQKKAESLDLVIDLLGKLNANKSEFASADSKALKQMQTELQRVYGAITEFLEYSSNLVNDEGTKCSTQDMTVIVSKSDTQGLHFLNTHKLYTCM